MQLAECLHLRRRGSHRCLRWRVQCGVAILLKGTQEQRLRFVFHVYERDRDGSIRTTDLVSAYVFIHSNRRFTVQQAEKAVAALTHAMRCRRPDQVRSGDVIYGGVAVAG